ncbi:acid protease [Atractiella rhizophila]|nr:acid protease [Atractiella rhizophila]
MGLINTTLYEGAIDWVDIPDNLESYWVVPLERMAINGTNLTAVKSTNVAIHTGTTLVGGPAAAIQALYSLIPGSAPATGEFEGYYSYPCNTTVHMSLTFGSRTYNITPDDFNLGPYTSSDETRCLGSFFTLDFGKSIITWVIGATFLKNVYSVYQYDPPAVGFAPLARSNLTSNFTMSLLAANQSNATGTHGSGPKGTQAEASLPPYEHSWATTLRVGWAGVGEVGWREAVMVGLGVAGAGVLL